MNKFIAITKEDTLNIISMYSHSILIIWLFKREGSGKKKKNLLGLQLFYWIILLEKSGFLCMENRKDPNLVWIIHEKVETIDLERKKKIWGLTLRKIIRIPVELKGITNSI